MSSLSFINGEIVSSEKGMIGLTDLALQRGYGVFDYGRTRAGKLFHFEDNLKRFRNSAAELHLEVPLSDNEILPLVAELIEGSDLEVPAVRMLLTGGYSDYDSTERDPNLIIIAEELPTYSHHLYENGCSIITSEFERELPHIKSINYLNAIRLEPLMRKANAFDVLYFSDIGITECPRNNFYAFSGDTLITARDRVLHGITRQIILDIAGNYFDVELRNMDLSELADIGEAFVSSTSKSIMPVTKIDGHEVGNGRVGVRTAQLMDLFEEYSSNY